MQWWVDYCLKSKMPATYSKNRDPKKIGEETKRPGGPLRRTGAQAVEWDEALGPSLDALPSAQLPANKNSSAKVQVNAYLKAKYFCC